MTLLPPPPRTKTRAFVLVTTVVLLTIVVTVAFQLASTLGVDALSTERRHRRLAHDLAVSSALIVAAAQLEDAPRRLIRDLDRTGVATLDFELGAVRVHCRMADNAAKIHPHTLHGAATPAAFERAVRRLGRHWGRSEPVRLVPTATSPESPLPGAYVWFDQLLDIDHPGALFAIGPDEERGAVWSDGLTLWGDGRVAVRRVLPDVLGAAVDDLAPGLARTILAHRRAERDEDFLPNALAALDEPIRNQVAPRLVFDAQRYDLVITTACGADVRYWYVVAELTRHRLRPLHRGQIIG